MGKIYVEIQGGQVTADSASEIYNFDTSWVVHQSEGEV